MTRHLLALLLLCAACKHSTSSSSTSHSETSTVTDTTSSESGATTTTTVVQTEPGETVTTISEYDPPAKEEPGSSEDSEARPQGVRLEPPASAITGLPRNVPRRGALRKQTVIEDKHGATTAKTAQEATSQGQSASETKAAGKQDVQAKAQEQSAPSAGCIGSSWLIGLGILLFAVALILGVLRFRKAV